MCVFLGKVEKNFLNVDICQVDISGKERFKFSHYEKLQVF